ncbi:MAG TPA: hypothetical protein VIQ97_03785, partial [Prevotella sp.]
MERIGKDSNLIYSFRNALSLRPLMATVGVGAGKCGDWCNQPWGLVWPTVGVALPAAGDRGREVIKIISVFILIA